MVQQVEAPSRGVAARDARHIAHGFDTTGAFTIGVEEEFVLVDPASGEVRPRASEVLDGCVEHDGALEPEVVASVVEGVTPVCATLDDLGTSLHRNRSSLSTSATAAGCALVGTGAHPFSPGDQPLAEGARYEALAREYPWVLQEAATYGLHVHVGVQGADRAIAICDAMRPWLPHLLALSANSPFWRGERTGLQSTRVLLAQLYPRSGVPPVFRDYDGYCRAIRSLEVSASVRDYTHTWWFVRPHPKWGTLEVRICDAQTDVRRSIALAALVRALIAWIDDELVLAAPATEVPAVVIEENVWAAARDGSHATFIDHDLGHGVSAERSIRELLHVLTPYVTDFGAAEYLPLLQHMVACTGADEQLLAHQRADGDMTALVRELANITTRGTDA